MTLTPHPITLQELTDQLEMAHSVRQTLCADIAKLTEELVEAKLHSAQERERANPNPNTYPNPIPYPSPGPTPSPNCSPTLTLIVALPYPYP